MFGPNVAFSDKLNFNSTFMHLVFHEIYKVFLCEDDFTFCPVCYDLIFGLLPGACQTALYCDWLSRPSIKIEKASL